MTSVLGRRKPVEAVSSSSSSSFELQQYRKRAHVDLEGRGPPSSGDRALLTPVAPAPVPEGADTVLRRYRRAGSPMRPALRPVVYTDRDGLLKTLARMVEDERVQMEGRRVRSEYAAVRRTVADWVLDLQKAFHLSTATVALAILYFDTVVSSMAVTPTELESTIAACVLIAYKFQEPDIEVATRINLNLLSECCEGGVTPNAIKRQEGIVLAKGLRWSLNRLCAAHFLDTLLALTADPEAVADSRWLPYVNSVASQMLGLALRDDMFVTVAPSLTAAACVSAARRVIAAELRAVSPVVVDEAGASCPWTQPRTDLPATVLAVLRARTEDIAPLIERLTKMFEVGAAPVCPPPPATPVASATPATPSAGLSPNCVTDI